MDSLISIGHKLKKGTPGHVNAIELMIIYDLLGL